MSPPGRNTGARRATDARGRANRRSRIAMVAVLGVALAAGVALLATSDDTGRGSESAAFTVGERVPAELNLDLLEGGPTPVADLQGRPLVINFFASWCPPCAAEMPDFETVNQEVGDDVLFIGVAQQDTRSSALRLVERTGVTYPIADDPRGELFRAFGAFAMPTTVFIDADGTYARRHSGIMSAGQLRGAIDELHR